MAILEQVTSQEAIDLENKHGAHNYHPLPVKEGMGSTLGFVVGFSLTSSLPIFNITFII